MEVLKQRLFLNNDWYTAFHVSDGIGSVSHNAMHDSFAETEGQTQIFICDINPKMLNIGKKSATLDVRYTENNYLHWVEGNAKALSFEDGSMDGYTIEFGIRNVTHIEKALAKAYRFFFSSHALDQTSFDFALQSNLKE
ncbi:2-methoxy-6-polyprenyl-1,4-benzoquinol methylase, mitochondrial-like [Zingiber officinale]|uniref:2-methoxy-6-polyprenyl-1,4-benzoquinol methylase, mitochondrial-like n=1 Tax=Zingiber officinale TaxID=94328 RepID=UPI001C4CAF13|nr:2-methoxy-6-polyprenyl-1,4-benzoquinol methylase, mitochondrial-like [Zingiber officinale]